jgi:hypothetical protein
LFTGVIDTGNKFIASAGVVDTGKQFIISVVHFYFSAVSTVNDTGDKFIAGINDTAHQRKYVTKINQWCF